MIIYNKTKEEPVRETVRDCATDRGRCLDQRLKKNTQVYLDSSGRLYEPDCNGRLLPVPESKIGRDLKNLSSNPYSSFFKTPFHQLAYAQDGVVKGSFTLTPGDFNPGSPFDAIYAVREYLFNNRLYIPRLYLYPEAKCNSYCKLCQFHSRHKTGGSLSKSEMLAVLDELQVRRGDIRSQSLIISGDGEPLIYPEIKCLLRTAKDKGFRVFLTTNLLTGFEDVPELYELIVSCCSMVTVSIKGLTPESYAEQQGLKGMKGMDRFGRVIENLRRLSDIRRRENPDMLLGIASLILPENSGAYSGAIELFHEIGAAYIYFNQVEPSLAHWGIVFTEAEKAETLEVFENYAKNPYRDMVVRCAENPFRERYGDTVYYDAASQRENPDICGSALFNPLVMSEGENAKEALIKETVCGCDWDFAQNRGEKHSFTGDKASIFNKEFGQNNNADACRGFNQRFPKWFACRNSSLFDDNRFEISELSPAGMRPVMEAAAGCRACRLERQVRHFDKLISAERKYGNRFAGFEYYLVFDRDKINSGENAFVRFDRIV